MLTIVLASEGSQQMVGERRNVRWDLVVEWRRTRRTWTADTCLSFAEDAPWLRLRLRLRRLRGGPVSNWSLLSPTSSSVK